VQTRILEFTNILRRAGVRVSTAEALDAFQALEVLSIDNRAGFRDALGATMVKRAADVATFHELFDLFWSGFYDSLRESFDQASAGLSERMDYEALLRQIAELLQTMDDPPEELSDLARAMLVGDFGQLESLIRSAAGEAGIGRIENFLQVGFFTRRTLDGMGVERAEGELRALMDQLRAAGMSDDETEAMGSLINGLMDAIRKSVRNFTEREIQQRNHDYMEKYRQETLLEKSFYHLTEDEVRKMREVVERLAQKIKNILTIRRRRMKRGKLDLHQTLRSNMSHGGIPFEIAWKHRRKDRPKLVILCDVSSSVANVSRFMLQFCYSLQEAFTKIRSFIFVSELGEVTHLFKDADISESIERALQGGDVVNVYTRSNFGNAFHVFAQNYLSAVDKKTTVLILGDARNNYNDPKAWCLREIHNRAKDVIWLNPENPNAWGFGDSVMNRYAPFADVAEECRNLRQLSNLIDQLILR
jgi:uncharacterized protein with von Willebrand factor type A (vWA) domain